MKLLNIVLPLLVALLVPSAARAQASCPGNGAGEPGCAAAGNPLNVITGNKFQREVDLAPLPGVMGLEIVRYYNSSLSGLNSRTGILGRGWRLSYETTLAAIGDTVQVLQADGTRLIFARDLLRPSLCSSADPANGEIDIRRTPRGYEYVWRKTDGQRLSFNTQGRLVQMLAPSGEFVSMQHDARGWLVKVTDPQGRSLKLDYLDRKAADGTRFSGVSGIDTPVGRFDFGYGSSLPAGANVADRRQLLANLVQVTTPDGAVRAYHYENARFPTLMTGISIQVGNKSGQPVLRRFATYGYDSNALAISSTHADGVGRIDLDHTVGGRTVLTNSLGQKTVYRYSMMAGSLRIVEVRGAGCAQCGPTNVRYGYDQRGRLSDTTLLDTEGNAVETRHIDFDHYGRPAKISRIHHQGGKAGKPQWLQRFEYASGSARAPILISRPSVVPGHEYMSRIRYGDLTATRAVPLEITESGYVPTYDGTGVSSRITRTVRYSYDSLGRRTGTDGPLANAAQNAGPENSDITRTEHDPKTGLPSRTVAPGNMIAEVLERDAALRPVKVRSSDGYRMQTATISSNWRGQPESIQIEAAQIQPNGTADPDSVLTRTVSYRYDMQGRIESVIAPGQLTTRFAYDPAGRLTHRILPDGSKIAVKLDTEGRTTVESRYLGDSPTALSSTRFQYDAERRLTQVEDDIGTLGRTTYTSLGLVAELTNGLGIATRFSYDENGLLITRTQAAGTPDASTIRLGYDGHGRPAAITDANNVRTERRYDDFGRKVVEASPDRGLMLYVHDAAGRVTARVDESMVTTRYRYDHAGRLTALGADSDVDLVRYSYQGSHMVNMISTVDGNFDQTVERISNRYDALGQLVGDERWIARVREPTVGVVKTGTRNTGGPGLTFTTERQYDEAGRLVQHVLPDGHRLQYRYAPGKGGPIKGRPGQLTAVLFDDQIVVSDIEQSLAGGMTGYTNGNGVVQRIASDSRGRIVDLEAKALAPSAQGVLERWWRLIRAWTGDQTSLAGRLVYRQANTFDRGDRVASIHRQHAEAGVQVRPTGRTETFGYDDMDRLVQVQVDATVATRYTYDRNGNRVAETGMNGASQYQYAAGTNRLSFIDARGAQESRLAQAWLYHPTGAPLVNLVISKKSSSEDMQAIARDSRRIVYNKARRPITVFDADSRLVGSYSYNSAGERMAKSVYLDGKMVTTYSVYDAHRLVAEADETGRIMTHYLYLLEKPIAKVEIASQRGAGGRIWEVIRTFGRSLSRGQPTVFAIHTDHLGVPQAVTDDNSKVVWQGNSDPFGKIDVRFATNVTGNRQFEMKLRLPGQVHDAETGLHQNYYRDYDPVIGRYLTTDPIGLAGGLNPYEYAASNPVTKVDPLGLYQSDVHFYMTYFLAIVAGMGAEDARVMALAAQYIDDNEDTHPLDDKNIGTIITSPLWNKENLAKYHFVLWTQEHGESAKFNQDVDTSNPVGKSPQLANLLGYARDYDAKNCAPNNISLQFMGEFLHTFQDTFAHRSPKNEPFPLNGGIGHGMYGSHPDYTYNHESWRPSIDLDFPYLHFKDEWVNNESRTLAMEIAVYEQIVEYMDARNYEKSSDKLGKVTVLVNNRLMRALLEFNACQVDEQSDKKKQNCAGQDVSEEGQLSGMEAKIQILNQALIDLGYDEELIWAPDGDGVLDGYNVDNAAKNREKFFNGLKSEDYPAAILRKEKK